AGLPGLRLQHEVACAMIQSRPVVLQPGAKGTLTFFGLYRPDHAGASSDDDLAAIDRVERAAADFSDRAAEAVVTARSLVQDAAPVVALPLEEAAIAERWPERAHEERADGRLVS